MEAIYIPQLLKMPAKQEEISLNSLISGLKTLTPVRGILLITHGGTFLQVELRAETIFTLTCDRCLQQYNHRLKVETSEIIWLENDLQLDKKIPLEREISSEDLSETLPPDGYFEVESWLYEQISLAMPMRQLCGKDCQPPPALNTDNLIDSRWASLASLKSLIKD
jgi:uncharacterized protein